MKYYPKDIRRILSPLVEPKAMIFGLTLFFFVSALVRWDQEHERLAARGAFRVEDHFYPPLHFFLLILAALALWRSRWWSYSIASLLMSSYLYLLGYRWLYFDATFHDGPVLSTLTLKRGWFLVTVQPQEAFGLIIAVLISIYTAASIISYIFLYRVQIVNALKRGNRFQ